MIATPRALDALLISASHELERLQPTLATRFTFMWREIAFSARAERNGATARPPARFSE